MDTTEPLLPLDPEPEIVITPDGKYYLHTAGQWASFLGIIGFIITGLILILALFMGGIYSKIGAAAYQSPGEPAGMAGIMTAFASFLWIFYLALAIFYFFLSLYLYKFGSNIKAGTALNDSNKATQAFSSLKSLFKLWGITAIVVISLYILIIIAAVVIAVGMRSSITH